jgi:hypothetical protein
MGKLLERILSPIKSRIGMALMTTTLMTATASSENTGKGSTRGMAADYFATPVNITEINTQAAQKRGLIRSQENGANSIGNYRTPTRDLPSYYQNIKLIAGTKGDTLSFAYFTTSPSREEPFREAHAETHIYFVLPEGSRVEGINQKQLLPLGSRIKEVSTRPGREFSLNTHTKRLNENYGLQEEDYTLEQAVDTGLALSGITGDILGGIKDTMEYAREKDENKRIKQLRKTYGEKVRLIKMPFYRSSGTIAPPTGRNTELQLDLSDITGDLSFYIEIPNITFEASSGGSIRTMGLEDLVYKIPINQKGTLSTRIQDTEKFSYLMFNAVKNRMAGTFRIYSTITQTDREGLVLDKFLDKSDSKPSPSRQKIETAAFLEKINAKTSDQLFTKGCNYYMSQIPRRLSITQGIDWRNTNYMGHTLTDKHGISIFFSENDQVQHTLKIKALRLADGWFLYDILNWDENSSSLLPREYVPKKPDGWNFEFTRPRW